MTTEDFRAWHKARGYTYETGAEAFGMSRPGYAKMLAGKVKIDRRTALACTAIMEGLQEWPIRACSPTTDKHQ